MAWTFRAAAQASGGGSSVTVDKPVGTVENDLVVASINGHDASSISVPSGWTGNTNQVQGANVHRNLYIVAGASEPSTYAFTTGGEVSSGVLASFANVDTVSPFDTQTSRGAAASTSHTADGLDPTGADSLLIFACGPGALGSPLTWTPPSGMTEADEASGDDSSAYLAYEFLSTGDATGDQTATASSSRAYMAQLIAYNQASSVSIEQEGFRFRNDDGSESGATWRQSQDVDDSVARDINIRCRVLVNATGDPASEQYQLEYKETGDGDTEYRKVPL